MNQSRRPVPRRVELLELGQPRFRFALVVGAHILTLSGQQLAQSLGQRFCSWTS
jgi:hypothetical protein